MASRDSISFSDHALFQMSERGISKQVVLRCLSAPEKITQQRLYRYRAMKILEKGKKDYLLVVVYDLREKQIEVVTVLITSKIQKYL